MKKIIQFIIFAAVISLMFGLSVGATETVAETVTETVTEVETVDPDEVDEMIESIVDGVRDGALSPKDAILMVAEIAGMTRDKAEELINKAISAGDAYLQDTTWWEGIRAKVLENLEFFVICIVAGSAILAIVGGAALLYIKVLRPIRNIDYGTSAVAKDSVDIKEAISQALEKLNEDIMSALKSGELTRAELLDRDTKHSELEAQLMGALQENADLKRGMVDSEMYILQILKLIYSRTDLTLTDKSVLDMWITKAECALQSNMDEGNIQKHDEMKEILKGEEGNA